MDEKARNKYDSNGSFEMGQSGEDLFESIGKEKGWLVIPASRYDNIVNHIDYGIKKGDKFFYVDVKGQKRVSRGGKPQDDKIWVELRNVRGKAGWLYGQADLIAFETATSFKIVHREKLVKLVEKLVDVTDIVEHAWEALYKVYTREGREDVISMIESKHLDKCLWQEWQK